MVTDIVKGTFKGFALLRQITNPGGARAGPLGNPMAQPRPVYAPGYGLIPPSQVGRGTRQSPAVSGLQRPRTVQHSLRGPRAPAACAEEWLGQIMLVWDVFDLHARRHSG